MQTLVEIGPSNASHNLTTLIHKRHTLMRTSVLYNGINSGQ